MIYNVGTVYTPEFLDLFLVGHEDHGLKVDRQAEPFGTASKFNLITKVVTKDPRY